MSRALNQLSERPVLGGGFYHRTHFAEQTTFFSWRPPTSLLVLFYARTEQQSSALAATFRGCQDVTRRTVSRPFSGGFSRQTPCVAGRRIRTIALLITNQPLCQLSYASVLATRIALAAAGNTTKPLPLLRLGHIFSRRQSGVTAVAQGLGCGPIPSNGPCRKRARTSPIRRGSGSRLRHRNNVFLVAPGAPQREIFQGGVCPNLCLCRFMANRTDDISFCIHLHVTPP